MPSPYRPIIAFLALVAAASAPAAVPPPSVEAKAYVLVDFDSGAVVATQRGQERVEPASLTKIMTIYTIARELAAGRVKLADDVLISEKAWRTGGSKMFVEVGKRVRLEDLMKGDIIQSGNDASVALAEHVSGTEEVFAALMNENARRLGMDGSQFRNSTGLPDPEHYTTAQDIATLSVALIREFPDIYAWFSTPEFTWNGITQRNRNRLLQRDPTVDGIKTGFTDAAGYCLAASAVRESRRLVAVVLGSPGDKARTEAASALLNWGFRFSETHRVYAAGQAVTQVRVWKGEVESLDLGLAADLYVTVPQGRYEALDARLDIQPQILAPVAAGQALGTLTLRLDDAELARRPLVAGAAVPEGGLVSRLIDDVRLLFE